jgi:acyl-CoA thioesterase II
MTAAQEHLAPGDPQAPPAGPADLLAWLQLEELDRDLYRGANEICTPPRTALYGGQVAAQALRAAALTVATDRYPHSLHGYFLRPGTPDRPVILRVERDRDGRSFSARRVAVTQNGEVIFEMSASFHVPEQGPNFELSAPAEVPQPQHTDPSWASWSHPACESRAFPVPAFEPGVKGVPLRLWGRSTAGLGDDPVMHACLIAYMSDLNSGFGELDLAGLPLGGPSIDHALWFHHPGRADDWLLFDAQPIKVGGGRGLYTGSVHDIHGRLVAMYMQEALLRTKTN